MSENPNDAASEPSQENSIEDSIETPSNSCEWIIDTTEATFDQDVLERSEEMLVVVDFWAPWCQPCRILAPILEEVIQEQAGKVMMVKANVDEISASGKGPQVQSVPTVIAFRNKEVVDAFQGLKPKEEIVAWINACFPSEVEKLIKQGNELEESNPEEAISLYKSALEKEPEHVGAKISLARVLLDQNQIEECTPIMSYLADRGILNADVPQLAAKFNIALVAQKIGSVDECKQALAESPDEMNCRLNFAFALAADKQYEAALIAGLEIVRDDQDVARELARGLMINIFHLLGNESELTHKYQRKLTMALF